MHLLQNLSTLSPQYERLRSERQAMKTEMASLQEDLRKAQLEIIEDKATIAMQVRAAQAKELETSEIVRAVQAEKDALNHQVR